MNFKESFQIKKATAIYKEDLIILEELIKADDISEVYGMNFRDDKYLKFTFHHVVNGVNSSHDYTSISDISSEYENIEINTLDIEKRLYAESSWKHKIIIRINRSFINVDIWGDDKEWVKTRRLLLEDYFANHKLTSKKFNYWITVKLEKYLPVISGVLMGPGLAAILVGDFGERIELLLYFSLISGSLLFLLSFFLVSTSFRSKYFPINTISYRKKPEEHERNKLWTWLTKGLNGLFWSFIFFLLVKFFLN